MGSFVTVCHLGHGSQSSSVYLANHEVHLLATVSCLITEEVHLAGDCLRASKYSVPVEQNKFIYSTVHGVRTIHYTPEFKNYWTMNCTCTCCNIISPSSVQSRIVTLNLLRFRSFNFRMMLFNAKCTKITCYTVPQCLRVIPPLHQHYAPIPSLL